MKLLNKLQRFYFTENKVYQFTLLKKINWEENDYFVIRSEWNSKHMLPVRYYHRYGFSFGDKLQCRVDKVNCNGRIFFEPLHPFYIEGQSYRFQIIVPQIINGKPRWYYFQLKDQWGNISDKIPASGDNISRLSDNITCLLTKIKKGRLFLEMQLPELEHNIVFIDLY